MKTLKELKPGKYTVVGYNDFGFLYCIHLTLLEVRVEPYAQHPESTLLVFKRKGARNVRGLRFLPHDDYLVYAGWVAVDTDPYRNQAGDGTRSSLLSLDREYLRIAKRSVAAAPILEQISELEAANTARILGNKGV